MTRKLPSVMNGNNASSHSTNALATTQAADPDGCPFTGGRSSALALPRVRSDGSRYPGMLAGRQRHLGPLPLPLNRPGPHNWARPF